MGRFDGGSLRTVLDEFLMGCNHFSFEDFGRVMWRKGRDREERRERRHETIWRYC